MQKKQCGFFKFEQENTVFQALKTLGSAGVFQGYLAAWFHPITHLLNCHANPSLAAVAIIELNQYFKARGLPPPPLDSVQGRRLIDIICGLSNKPDPRLSVKALICLQKKTKHLPEGLKDTLLQLFLAHPFQLHLVAAVVIMSQFELFAQDRAKDNLEYTKIYAQLWFADPSIRDLFKAIPNSAFTQAHFDELVALSADLSPDNANLPSIYANIQHLLTSIQPDPGVNSGLSR